MSVKPPVRPVLRLRAGVLLGSVLLAGVAAACSSATSASGPVDDTVPGKKDAGATSVTEGGSETGVTDGGSTTDGAATDASSKADSATILLTYLLSCSTQLSNGDPNNALRWWAESSGGVSPTLTITSLKGWDTGTGKVAPPTTFAKSARVGSAVTAPGFGDAFSLNYATLNVPAEGNSAQGTPLTFKPATFSGKLGTGGRLCGGLGGTLTAPVTTPFDANFNPCVLVPLKEGAPIPALSFSDHQCVK
jgi:hypothetical protein